MQPTGTMDVQSLTEEIKQRSQFVDAILAEASKVVVGQRLLLERLLLALLCDGHVLLEGLPGSGEDADDQDAGRRDPRGFPAHSVHAGSSARGPGRHDDLQPENRRFHAEEGPDFHESRSGRRDQPRARQSAERAARGDGRASGHDRRDDLSDGGSVHRCWRRRTRSSRKEPIRFPKRSSTVFFSK